MRPGQESEDLELAITQAAPRDRDIEAERIFANLRERLAGVEQAPPMIGRFEVSGTIGRGAMGTVYRARDPELEREVAIKVLREDGRSHSARLAEARALARLSHPNTVTVYEAGEDRGAVFIAMELIRGQTLTQWASEPENDWRHRLAVMIAAGRGLAAAHAAGIVHGDFKPDNVLVGDEPPTDIPFAHVRVADFGLARVDIRAEPDATSRPGRGLVGTPAYMSPEQLDGERATPESDQYSFAVSLFEVLRGKRPYASTSVESLRQAIALQPLPAVELKELPAWLRRAIARALSPDPRDRYPSMHALLADLDRKPRRRRIVAAAALGSALTAVAMAYLLGRNQADPCGSDASRSASLWSADQQARTARAFESTGVAHAARAHQELSAEADGFAKTWTAAYRQVCEATRVRGEQSDTLMDARMQCLSQRAQRARAVLRAAEVVRSGVEMMRAVSALKQTADIADCLAAEGVPADDRLPVEPELRARADSLLAEVERGWALYALGRYEEARMIAEGSAEAIDKIPSPLVKARGLYFRGAVEGRTGAPGQSQTLLRSALDAAAQAGADRLSADIWQLLLKDALFAGDHERVLEWADFARAAALRAGRSAAVVDAIVGESHLLAGRPQVAVDVLEAAVAELSRSDDRSDKSARAFTAVAMANLGSGLFELGRYDEAEARYQAALSQAQAELGAEHPGLARYYDKLGRVALTKGLVERAIEHHRRALAMRERAFGDRDRAVATSLLGLADALRVQGALGEAATALDRALAIRKEAYGPDHLRLAEVLQSRARVANDAGRTGDALADWQQALAIRRRDSPEHPAIAEIECYLRKTKDGGHAELDGCAK